MTFDAINELTSALEDYDAPLLVTFDENNCIVAAHYTYDSKYDFGVVFRHPKGPIDIGVSVPSDVDDDQMEGWVESLDVNLSEGLPGLAILSYFTDEEAEQLGLQKVDLAGPASGEVLRVKFSGNSDKLQDALSGKNLPFRVAFSLIA